MKIKIDYIKFAEEIARLYHKGQKRKDGSDYIIHLQAVAKLVKGKEVVIVAWLHDILEDTVMTKEILLRIGFNKGIVKSVVAITKKKEENYLDYILRCSKDEVALRVKLADLTHNLSDLEKGSLRDKYLLAKYILEKR